MPLTALASIREVTGAEIVERFNAFTSARRSWAAAAPGYSSGDAIAGRSRKWRAQTLPQGYAAGVHRYGVSGEDQRRRVDRACICSAC